MHALIHNDFALLCDPRWSDATLVTLTSPAQSGKSVNSLIVVRESLTSDMPLDEYSSIQEALLAARFKNDGWIVLERTKRKIGDLNAAVIVWRFRPPDSPEPIVQMQAQIVRGKDAVTLTGSAAASDFDTVRPQLAAMLSSFRFVDNG